MLITKRARYILTASILFTCVFGTKAFADDSLSPMLNHVQTSGSHCDDMYAMTLYEYKLEKEVQKEKEEKARLQKEKEEKERKEKNTHREIAEKNLPTQDRKTPYISNSTDKSTKVLEVGKKYIGVPYVFGGTSPSGFDCSGFTQYVVKQATGLDITRTSSSQPYCGLMHQINLSDARPGDLVYDIGQHAGIFISDGGSYLTILHASVPGDTVKIGQYHRNVSVYRLN